jgi:hypothetical protein
VHLRLGFVMWGMIARIVSIEPCMELTILIGECA